MTLLEGNKFFREGNYSSALAEYRKVVNDNNKLSKMAAYNINIIEGLLSNNEISVSVENVSSYEELQESYSHEIGLKNFDHIFYKNQLKDVADLPNSAFDLYKHFLSSGEMSGFMPHPSFSPKEYKKCNPDVSKGDSLSGCYQHFITYGAIERRRFWSTPQSQHHHEYFRYKILESKFIDWDVLSAKKYAPGFVSVIIPVYGEGHLLSKCINSILTSKSHAHYEIILVDNRKDKETSEIIKTLSEVDPRVKVHVNPFNFNFSLGCNSGFCCATGEYTIFLNTDTQVEDHWIDKLINPLSNPLVKAVQPKLVYSSSKIQTIGTALSNWSYMPFEVYKSEDIDSQHVNYSRYFNMVTAACIALKSSDFINANGFDCQYINGCEDIDLCLKLIDGYKYKCWYESSVTVTHLESKSSGRGAWNEVNRLFFVERWKSKIQPDAHIYFQQDNIIPQYDVDSRQRQLRRLHSCSPKKYKVNASHSQYVSPLFSSISADSDDIDNQKQDIYFYSLDAKFDESRPTILVVGHIAGKNLFGGERSFLDMLEALSELNLNIIVSLPNYPSRLYRDAVLRYANKLYVFGYKWWQPLKAIDRIESQCFYDICSQDSVDMIYVNTIMPCSYLYASQELDIPVVIHVRELILDDETFEKKLGIDKRDIILGLISRSDYLIANSLATRNVFSSYENVVLARNIVDISRFGNLKLQPSSTLTFGMISSNIPKKGIHDFFKLAYLSRNIKNIKFILVGPLTDEVKELIEEYADYDLPVEIRGYVSDPIAVIQEIDVILSLSHFSESFGRTIAEGFAARRPALGYDRGAVNELIIDGKTGYLIPPNNIDYASKIIERISKNPSQVRELGENAFHHLSLLCDQLQLRSGIAFSLLMSWIKRQSIDPQLLNRTKSIVSSLAKDIDSMLSLLSMTSSQVTIIIPIYNAFKEIRQCIQSVLSTCHHNSISILLIDDCSTDVRIVPYLRTIEQDHRVTVVYNQINLGYTKTINKAIKHAGSSDIILLNSDTVVNNDWIMQLRIAAYSSSDVGTVTPMSNNAGAFSFPKSDQNNFIPSHISLNSAARQIILSTKDSSYLQLPTGNGFCMYIKRSLIDKIGLFDEDLFPRGYGEENHFCMRAIQNNMKNLLCPHSYIFHVKTASFKSERTKLIDQGQKVLLKEFPSYMKRVKQDFNTLEMNDLRGKISDLYNVLIAGG